MTLLDALQAADYPVGIYGDDRSLDWTSLARLDSFGIGGHVFEVLDSDLARNEEEGENHEVYVVFRSQDGTTFKKTGYASSYDDDHYWDGPIFEVRPVEKTITVWEAK